jgi:type IV secretory pathway component VirB8
MNMKKEQKKIAIKDYLWSISQNDGHITSVKILEFLNSKSGKLIIIMIIIMIIMIIIVIIIIIIMIIMIMINRKERAI